MSEDSRQEHSDPHLFNEHSSARLTFVVGIVMGVALMTLGGIGFFSYVLNGGTVFEYDVQPLEVTDDLLEEPIKTIKADQPTIREDDTTIVVGAQQDYEVTLVTYVDYECLFCKKFFPELVDYAEQHSEQVRLLIKHDPLTRIHPHAKQAAVAAECAADQDKFLEYSQYLFDHQAELSEELYTQAATELELDTAAFSACVQTSEPVERVQKDAEEADQLGVASQPNLVVWHNQNSSIELIDGYVSQSYLDDLLAAEISSNDAAESEAAETSEE